MAYKVLIPQPIAKAGIEYLVAHGCEIKEGKGIREAELIEDIKDCDAVVARTAIYSKSVIEAGEKLKVIARSGIGIDNIDIDYAAKRGIWVTNGPHSNINSVAEQTMHLILDCAKKGSYLDAQMRKGNFHMRNQVTGMDIQGKVLGIIGLGRIGRLVAQKAKLGFEMKVIGYDPYISKENAPEGVIVYSDIVEVLSTADFVSLHLPVIESTRQSIGKEQFLQMKKTAYLINAARGELVKEKELIDALKYGLIAGAGVDVYEEEPPGAGHPFYTMNNVVMSPHFAAMTDEALERMGLHAAMGVIDVMEGRTPEWSVNKPI